MKNIERLKKMSSVELSKELCGMMKGCGHCICYEYCNWYTDGEGNGIQKWLERESKED